MTIYTSKITNKQFIVVRPITGGMAMMDVISREITNFNSAAMTAHFGV
jgi:hypothetical protein